MRKKTSALKYVCAVLSTVFVAGLISLGIANPYSQARDSGVGAPPSGTEPPTISIFSPLNYIMYDSSNVSLTFKVNVGKPSNTVGMGIHSIYYRADWLGKDIYVNSFDLSERDSEFLDNLTLTGVPSGYHTITVYAIEIGRYYPDYFHFYRYYVTGSSSVSFNVGITNNATTAFDESRAPLDAAANPPVVEILNPKNSTAFRTTDVDIDFKVKVWQSGASAQILTGIFFKTDWEVNSTRFYSFVYDKSIQPAAPLFDAIAELSTTKRLRDVPLGNRNITITAIEARQYDGYTDYANNLHYKVYEVNASSSVSFVVDVSPPRITVLSPENKTYMTSAVPLNFIIDESCTKIVYNLDGKEKVTIDGNVTLTGLPVGTHSLEVYAVDLAGNTGYSNTVLFTIEPFPTIGVTAAIISSVAFIAVIFHFARNSKKKEN